MEIFTVSGMGGIGKTELALQYSQQQWKNKTYPGGICWLQAQSENLGTDILKFAKVHLNLNPPEDFDPEMQIEYCWQNWPIPPNPPYEKSDVLLIFDDVWKYKTIEKFLPSNPRFKILVTTRWKCLDESFESLELKVLSELEALELLVSFIDKKRMEQEPEQAQLLCKDLGYLPLGLELVGRYLKRKSRLSLAKMREQLSLAHNSLQKRDRKGETSPEMTAKRGVEAAFELSWQELNEEEQKVAYLLSLFALAPIKWEWVEQSLPEQDTEDLKEIRDDVLVNLSLLQVEGENTYQLHQLIREFLIEKQQKIESTNQIKEAFCQTMVAIAKETPQTLAYQQILDITSTIPHLIEVAKSLTEYVSNDDLVWPFLTLNCFYLSQGLYKKSEAWNKKSLEFFRNRLGEEHEYVALSYYNLATLYLKQRRYDEARDWFLKSLRINQKLPEQNCQNQIAIRQNCQNQIAILHSLVKIYISEGKYEGAEFLTFRTLYLQQQLSGKKHPDIAFIVNTLAELYYFQRRYEEAEQRYLEALNILGEKHPNIALIRNGLATVYCSQKKYREAELEYQRALEMAKEQLGENHPDTQTVLKNLQRCLQEQGSQSE